MSQPANTSVTLVYRDQDAADGEVVGALRILDEEQLTVAERSLVAGMSVEVRLPGPGLYFAHGTLASGERLSGSFRVRPGPALQHVHTIVRRAHAQHTERSLLNGWIAGWEYDGGSSPYAASVSEADGGLLAAPSRSDGGNLLAQMSVGDQPASCMMLAPGLPMRIVPQNGQPGYQFVPGDRLAATMLAFLHVGDLLSARLVTPRQLPPPDDGLALVMGYQFVRCYDDRLERWTRALLEARPDSFDAHLLRGFALLRQPSAIAEASEAFTVAARHGLPVLAMGLRLFDHGLRLLSQGKDRPDLEDLRQRHMRYLRCVFDTAVTSFWGPDPHQPTLEPVDAVAPAHARQLRLTPATTGWLAAVAAEAEVLGRSVTTQLPGRLLAAAQRLGRDLLAVHPVRLSTAGTTRDSSGQYTGATFDLPPGLEALLGSGAMGTIMRAGDDAVVVVANVRPDSPPDIQFAVVLGDEPHAVQLESSPTSEELYARIQWPAPDLPDRLTVLQLGPAR